MSSELKEVKSLRGDGIRSIDQEVLQNPDTDFKSLNRSMVQNTFLRPNVIVITVAYNNIKHIQSNIKAIKEQDYSNYFHVILDDCSTDGTAQSAQKMLGNDKVFRNKSNIGRCATLNRYLSEAPETKYIILLNASVVVDKSFITEMVKFAESKGSNFGGATSQVVDIDTGLYYNVMTPTRGIASLFRNTFVNAQLVAEGELSCVDSYREVDSFWGCCCILNAAMVKKFKFNEYLITFGEEPDLAIRAMRFGYKFYHIPWIKVRYKPGASTIDEHGPTPYRVYYGIRNNVYLSLVYGSKMYALVIIAAAILKGIYLFVRRPLLFKVVLSALHDLIVDAPMILTLRKLWANKKGFTAVPNIRTHRLEVRKV